MAEQMPSDKMPLASRIRHRMAAEPDVIEMSDELVERIAGLMSPVPPARRNHESGTGSTG